MSIWAGYWTVFLRGFRVEGGKKKREKDNSVNTPTTGNARAGCRLFFKGMPDYSIPC
jgi:hypothetical protein